MIENLGPYRIEKVIGRGGMGTVYLGVHQESGERAALKALSVGLMEDWNFRERFATEIETLKKLNHPNIVRLFGEGEQAGHLFYVMEYVDGPSLQQELLAGRRFHWTEVTRIAIQICGALKHAHDRGVIHRDLKPANLLRDREGRIKLTDFGIAKLFGGTHLTADGTVVGTADYMSPEQAESGSATSRSDLYSLGCVMFTLLARRPPFTGQSLPQVIYRVRYDRAPSVRDFGPQIPLELGHIIDQLLQKDPRDRVATALALSNRLQAMQYALGPSPPAEEEGSDAEEKTRPLQLDPSAQDQGTVAPGAADGAATQISLTSSGDEQSEPESCSWNRSTVSTAGDSAKEESLLQLQSTDKTVAELPRLTTNRFVPVDTESVSETPLRRTLGEKSHHFTTALLLFALLAVLAAAVWGMWPASADSLYQQIIAVSQEQGPAEAKQEIDEFLERFPNDPRAAEVDDLRKDVQYDWLQSRLALRDLKSGGSDLRPFETLTLEAMRALPQDPGRARKHFRQLLQQYDEPSPSAELKACLDAARHQLKRLEENSSS